MPDIEGKGKGQYTSSWEHHSLRDLPLGQFRHTDFTLLFSPGVGHFSMLSPDPSTVFFPRDAMQSAVMRLHVVCLSLRDV